jgi:TusA-related sulfurtransferase/ketosteroid isomerase-like protein
MLDLAANDPVPLPSALDRIATRLGLAFVQAIVAGDFDQLETLFAPDMRFRAITPDDYVEASTATGAGEVVRDWFGDTDRRELLGSTVDMVGDRLALGYRLELTEADGRRIIVQQHAAATIEGVRISDLSLVCSGFRPQPGADADEIGTLGTDASDAVHPAESPSFTPAAQLDAAGLSCATLTPTIRSAIRDLDFGAVLEILTDDPDAEEGLRSWTRLTGNELVAAAAGPGSARRFAIRRSPRPAAT